MTEVIIGVVVGAALVVAFYWWIDNTCKPHRDDVDYCKHEWTLWGQENTEFAYVNTRQCGKCGYFQTRQVQKIGRMKQ